MQMSIKEKSVMGAMFLAAAISAGIIWQQTGLAPAGFFDGFDDYNCSKILMAERGNQILLVKDIKTQPCSQKEFKQQNFPHP